MRQSDLVPDLEPFFGDYLDRLTGLHEGLSEAIAGLPVPALDWQPGPQINSLAVLAVHTAGAETYWIGDVAGQRPSGRIRSEEFQARERSAADLQQLLDASLALSREVLAELSLADLGVLRLSWRDGEHYTVATALLHALEHTAQHMGHMQIGRQLWAQHAGPGDEKPLP